MVRSSPFSVRIERSGNAIGTVMNEIRSWLDGHKIEPTDFRPSESGPGAVAFEIRFPRKDEAHVFEQAFVHQPRQGHRR
jgi:hypothetical protein